MSLKHFIQITKPGIIFGNVLSVAGGFFLASKGHVDLAIFLAAMIGTSWWLLPDACSTTASTVTSTSRWSAPRIECWSRAYFLKLALIFATILGVAGVVLLYKVANPLAALFAVIGFVIYVGLYSLYLKRKSVHGTLVGSLSGRCRR